MVISTTKYRKVFGTFKCKTRERWGVRMRVELDWKCRRRVDPRSAILSRTGGQGEKCELKYNDFIQGKNMDDHGKKKRGRKKVKSTM